jgi:ferric-dicitrate binding protein FerR (iron transport regulator)
VSAGEPGFDAEVERALLALPRPAARAPFRAGLRRRFLEVDPDLRVGEPAPPPPPASPHEVWRRRALKVGAIAAAALVLLVLFELRPRGPRWSVIEASPGAIVRVDGTPRRADDAAALEEALVGAEAIESEAGTLRLRLGDLYLLELGPGTALRLSTLDRAARAEPLAIRAERGSVRVRTGPAFAGSRMRVSAPNLDLRVVGTTFAVDRLEHGTCVCCFEGTVELVAGGVIEDPSPLGPGRFCIVDDDEARGAQWGDVHGPHAEALRELETAARAIWP